MRNEDDMNEIVMMKMAVMLTTKMIKIRRYARCATHETHSYEDEMEETVNLADLESAEIFGGEVNQ